ncbi:uncharacterized protein [Musca autumnalis]|uniref:uncharacterized protein n=1 Tax=Musca autumnalis TaxID=221902 RepID=UPI003CE6CC2E
MTRANYYYSLRCPVEPAGVSKYVSHKNCNNVTSGRIIAHPDNCSQYIVCNGLRSTLGECPEGLYYNPEMLSCDKMRTHCRAKEETSTDQSNLQTTTEKPTTTTPIPSTTTRAPTTPLIPLYSDGRPLCSMWQDLEFPHPYRCSYYYKCLKGFLIIRKCRIGYIWDWLMQRCVPEPLGQCYAHKYAVKKKSSNTDEGDGYVRLENEILLYFLRAYS